jgi:hypothetical protein
MRLEILVVGVWHIMIAGGGFLAALGSDHPLTTFIVKPLLLGVALTALQMSDYICRTNPATPGKGGRGKLVKASLH